MAVLRQVVGETLRAVRLRQRRTLREVSSAARVSLGYLSEVERGQKEPSSELLAAICGALDVELSELFREVTDTLYREEKLTLAGEPGSAPARHSRIAPRAVGGARRAGPIVAHRRRLITVRVRIGRVAHDLSSFARVASRAMSEASRPAVRDTVSRFEFGRRDRVRGAGSDDRHAQPGRQRDGTHAGGAAGRRRAGRRRRRHEDHDVAGRRALRGGQGDPVQPLPHPRRRAGGAAGPRGRRPDRPGRARRR